MKFRITVLAFLGLLLPMSASAGFVFTIDNYTTTELAFSISGTFDADTIGDNPGILAIKKDWSNNLNLHTELWAGAPTITTDTLKFNGIQHNTTINTVDDPNALYADSLWLYNVGGDQAPFTAGFEVSGSIVLTGNFDPILNPWSKIELVSGFYWDPPSSQTNGDYARLEAVAVLPVSVPAMLPLFALGLAGLGWSRRKKA